MGKRQKLILILYAFAVFLVSFLYVPIVRYYSDGVKIHAGHSMRPTILTILWVVESPKGYVNIDAQLMIAEIIALTAIAAAGILFLKRQ